jgi:hypothetical protein
MNLDRFRRFALIFIKSNLTIAQPVRPVFDNELLSETLRQPPPDQAGNGVLPASGGKANDDAHRPNRISLRACDVREGGQRSGAPCDLQKLTTLKFHHLASNAGRGNGDADSCGSSS